MRRTIDKPNALRAATSAGKSDFYVYFVVHLLLVF